MNRIEKTIEALKKNNMEAYFVETRDEAVDLTLSLIEKGSSVGVGGSVTLNQLGMLEILRNGDYDFFDRYAFTEREKIEEMMH